MNKNPKGREEFVVPCRRSPGRGSLTFKSKGDRRALAVRAVSIVADCFFHTIS